MTQEQKEKVQALEKRTCKLHNYIPKLIIYIHVYINMESQI